MQNDDMYPNDGTQFYPREPEAQVKERRKEKAETLQALPILNKIIQHFEERIVFYGSVDAMPKEVKADPSKFLIMHNANEQTRANLMSEKEYIESLVDEHSSR